MIPADVRSQFTVTDVELKAELLHSTDWFTDELFSRPDCTVAYYPVSRVVVDPERFVSDDEEAMARVGRGVIYSHCVDGRPLRRALTASERQSLLDRFYRPHHAAFEEITAAALSLDQKALIIDAHSFPAIPWQVEQYQDRRRPDFCVGSDPFHTPTYLAEAALAFFESRGFNARLNWPYGGAIVPTRYYRTEPTVHALMIEVNRALYMDESTGVRSARFEEIKRTIQEVCSQLHRLRA